MPTSHNLQAVGPQVWGQAGLLQTGHDASASTIFPSVFTSNTAHYVEHNQGTAAADSSVDLAAYFTTGVIWETYLHVRSPAGSTITAEWYKAGTATGIKTTFAATIHMIVNVGQVTYTLGDQYAGSSLTLRLSGGDATACQLLMVGREIPFGAAAAVDTTDGATTVTDPQGVMGTVAEWDYNGHADADFRFLTATFPNSEEQVSWVVISAFDEGNITFHPSGMTSDYTAYLYNPFNAETYINSVDYSGWNGPFGWTMWAPYFEFDLTGASVIDTVNAGIAFERSNIQNTAPVTAADVFQLRTHKAGDLGFTGYTAKQYIWRWMFGRHVDDPTFTSTPGVTVFNPSDTFSLAWTHPHSTWVTHFEGVIYNSSGTVVNDVGAITSPWTVPVGVTGGTGFHASIQAVYDDGSYGWIAYGFDVTGSFHLLPLTGAGPA